MRKLGITALRLVIGTLMMGHGLQKLAGWFGGHGLDATGAAFESMGLRPGQPHATAAAVSETAGGALLAAGLLTPLGACMVTGSMAVAIHKVHWQKGGWITEGGFEYNLLIVAAAFAITAEGPGPISLDEVLGIEICGPGAAFAELAAGVLGATAVALRPQGAPEPAQEQAEPSPDASASAE